MARLGGPASSLGVAIDDYSHLWDGSEPGWVVQTTTRHLATVVLVFDAGGPNAKELVAVRRLLDDLRDRPLQETRRRFGGRRRVALDECSGLEARLLAQRARDLGLRTDVDGHTRTHHLFVNELTHDALVIEDDAESDAVAREALARGLPERLVEAD